MSGAFIENLKKTACDAIDRAAGKLLVISNDIWSNPELGHEEKHAHSVLTAFLEKHGFLTERSYKLETAFRATYAGRTPAPSVAFICEYDALPSIGHACGHNLIAEVGIAAGLGLMSVLKSTDQLQGKVIVLGTPAEEGPGGKIDLINAGAFSDVDVALMAHPFPANDPTPMALARETIEVTYTGKASHAAGYPWEGVNALDAAVMCIIKEGGEKVNIIPERAVLHIACRAPTTLEMQDLKSKVVNIFKAASLATGCKVENKTVGIPYSAMSHNKVMVDLYESNMASLQTEAVPSVRCGIMGSTDMGDVSQVVPSIHTNFYIGGRAVNHTREFTKEAGDAKAQTYTLLQAKALAMTAIDILAKPELLEKIKKEFQRGTES